MSRLIHNATTKKLVDLKDVHKYTSNYPAIFDKVVGFLIDSSHYTRKNIEMFFQATMFMNIETKYSALVLSIQKDWKDKITNLTEMVPYIIKDFEFVERNKKSNKIVPQISTSKPPARSRLSFTASKELCTN